MNSLWVTPFLDDIVTPAVKALRKEAPKVKVALFELSPRAQLDRLRDDELDVAILGNLGDDDRQRFSTRKLMRSRMAAVLPEGHRLARQKQIVLEELAKDSFVSLSNTLFPGRREFLRGICQSRDFEPLIVEESDSLPLLLSAVSGGIGVALPPLHSRKLPHAGCVFIPMKQPVVHAEVMAVFKGEGGGEPPGGLLRHLRSAANALEN